MTKQQGPILVFGATGQQGGSVAAALLKAGRQIRALVRDPASARSTALREAGAELVKGRFEDIASIRAAIAGAQGVFSVQPSSGQGSLYGVTDDDEVRYGTAVADAAVEAGVGHLVYSSTSAAGDQPVGVGHFDTKGRIESHIRSLPINATIVRPRRLHGHAGEARTGPRHGASRLVRRTRSSHPSDRARGYREVRRRDLRRSGAFQRRDPGNRQRHVPRPATSLPSSPRRLAIPRPMRASQNRS